MRISGRVISEPPMPRLARLSSSVATTIAEVLAVAALAVAAVLGRHRQAEGADLGQAVDDVLGHVAVRAVDVLGLRGDDVGGERAERVLHHLHVGVEVARPGVSASEARNSGSRYVARNGWASPSGAALDAPQLLAPGEPG